MSDEKVVIEQFDTDETEEMNKKDKNKKAKKNFGKE